MKLIPKAVSRTIARQTLLAQANSPSLLFGAGLVGAVGSTVLACRATLRLEEVLHEAEGDLEVAKSIDSPKYSEQDRSHDTTLIYMRTAGSVIRLYAPAALLGAASIGCLTKSHNILQERNLAVTAAYAAVDEAFKKYRARVVEKYGEDEDIKLLHEHEEVEVYDEELGQHITSTRVAPGQPSMYARFFDEYSTQWSKEPEYNWVFLRCMQNWANDMLKIRGHLFLNEVYRELGLSHTKPGALVGWMMAEDGDDYVDFGIFNDQNKARDFVNGREGSILLDFNVDGVIYDKIKDHGERLKWQS